MLKSGAELMPSEGFLWDAMVCKLPGRRDPSLAKSLFAKSLRFPKLKEIR